MVLGWGRSSSSSRDSSYSALLELEAGPEGPRPRQRQPLDIEQVKQWMQEATEGEAEEVLVDFASSQLSLVKRALSIAVGKQQTAMLEADQREESYMDRAALRPDPGALANSNVSPSIFQFSCGKYFCLEDEASVSAHVFRLGNSSVHSKVRYRTRDASAVAGQNYIAAAGCLDFLPGETHKSFDVELIDDKVWAGVLEFHVLLEEEGLVNAVLSLENASARVQRIDDDVFPTNKYREEIQNGRVHTVPEVAMFFEYFRLTFSDPGIAQGTKKMIFLGQVKNMVFVLKLLANVYLVDCILVPASSQKGRRGLGVDHHLQLLALVCCNFLVVGILHCGSYRQLSWGVGGRARRFLSTGLMNAFLYYDDTSRTQVEAAKLVEAMTTDTEAVIKAGYMNFLSVFHLLGRIFFSVGFQLAAPLAFGAQATWMGIVQMTVFPVLMVALFAARLRITQEVLEKVLHERHKLVTNVHDTVTNFRLIADYNKKHACMDRNEERVMSYTLADRAKSQVLENNVWLMKWLTTASVAIYLISGGMSVIDGRLPPGVFLTCLRVFVQVGAIWGEMFSTCLCTFNSAPALDCIIKFINLPTDTRTRMFWSRQQRAMTQEFWDRMADEFARSGTESGRSLLDQVPIKVLNLPINLRSLSTKVHHLKDLRQRNFRETTFFFDSLVIEQGKLISFVGKRGKGKSTLLRVLGGAVLPQASESRQNDRGEVFLLPAHLRVLHVPAESLFIRASLYENLTFGLPDDRDLSPKQAAACTARVREICHRLQVPKRIIESIDPDNRMALNWDNTLSASEKHLLCIARALVLNPEVLCLHKPTLHVNTSCAELIVQLLREFVDNRGICLPEEDRLQRRPRTCILTSTRSSSLHMADEIFKIDGTMDTNAVHRLGGSEALSEIALDDLC